jgi:hydrogenase maturation protein HypF
VDHERRTELSVDLAPCADCLRELSDPADRRYRYPFINCSRCGPRFTIARELPYERRTTTMSAFEMCAECLREYTTPTDRRFHAEPNACAICGPELMLVASRELVCTGDLALKTTAAALADGHLVALKSTGGFVLAVDATSEGAVVRLRERKQRPHRPFAVMARTLEDAERIAMLDVRDRELLQSPARPIVVVPARGGVLARSIAPGLADLGVMLPATPLEHLLLHDGPAYQVMTSANLTAEPSARTNPEAYARLDTIADAFLVHDREVHARVEDSVVRSTRRGPIPLRRARGSVPQPIEMPFGGPAILAVGGQERTTICLVHDGRAVLSSHLGDLEHPEVETYFHEAIVHLQQVTGVTPEVIAHDCHPDYQSTRWAIRQALPRVAVQHHHAHVAACLAEHGRNQRVTGIAFDGTGLGDDGRLWGGEILEADLGGSRRRGHLRSIALAGGELALRSPWRLAAAALIDAGETLELIDIPARERDRLTTLIQSGLPTRTTGAGRWFDAVAALIGAAREASYDGQAAGQLEAMATGREGPPFEIAVIAGDPFEIDLRPTIRELAFELRRFTDRRLLAARFHLTMAVAIHRACRMAAQHTVVLTGGCFQNRRLFEHTTAMLQADGFEVLTHDRVPPNDAGLALGQAAVALHRMRTPNV